MSYLKYFEPHVKGLQKSGPQLIGYCPFHPDEGSKRKGFSLDAEKGLWHCFSCGAKGNLYTFFKQLGLAIPDELQMDSPPPWKGFTYLKYRTPKNEQAEKWEPEILSPPNEKWRKKALHFIKLAVVYLNESPKCEDIRYWLITERGLSGKALSRLGWNPRDDYYACDSWGLERSSDLWIPMGLVIPVIQDGSVQRIQIRIPVEDRHILLAGSNGKAPMRLINGNRHAIVVESDLDALLLWRLAGDLVDVISLRSASNKPDVKSTKILREAEKILVALDSDAAGRKNTSWWLENFPNAKKFPLPPGKGKDPGEAFKGGFNLRAWISEEASGDRKSDKKAPKVSAKKGSGADAKFREDEESIFRTKDLGSSQDERIALVKEIFEGTIL